ncbi:MAG TPA: response regulator [Phycisphaerae bacterium]|nr:response regulator [Phycisphaerae bacterium]
MTREEGSLQRILLVEDDSGVANLIRSHLSHDVWSVCVAKTAVEALGLIRQQPEPYDYALVDVWLPQDEASSAQAYVGYQLAEQISALSPTTRIIGMSQFVDSPSALRTLGRFAGFVEKSALMEDPKAVLMRCLKQGVTLPLVACDETARRSEIGRPHPGLPWVLVAALAGMAAATLPLVFVLLHSGILRICLVCGILVFIVVLLLNPRRRYFSAFMATLGVWFSATAVPALDLQVDAPRFLLSFLTQGPGAMFHVAAVVICSVSEQVRQSGVLV